MDVESIKERWMIGYWNEAGTSNKHVERVDYKLLHKMLFLIVAKFMCDYCQYLFIMSLVVLQKLTRKLNWVFSRGSIRVEVARLWLSQRNFLDIVTNTNGQSINLLFQILFIIWEWYSGSFQPHAQ